MTITADTLVSYGFEEKTVNQKDYPFCSWGIVYVKKLPMPRIFPYLSEEFVLILNQNGFHYYGFTYIGSDNHLKELYKAIAGIELNHN